jgi:polyketide cyclase/dehydrase/lipid transport protein
MKILKIILLVLALAIAAYCAAGLMMSDTYDVQTSATIDAPSAEIHPWIENLEKWPEWTTWSQNGDDKPVITNGEKSVGVGAYQSWTSEGGDGELTITASDPQKGVAYTMFFVDGEEKMPAKCSMNYASEGQGTKVTWTMKGEGIPFLMRPVFKLGIESMIKSDFDKSLAILKSKVEKKS